MDDTAVFLECARSDLDHAKDKGSDIVANPKSPAIVLHGVGRFIELATSNVSVVNRRLTEVTRA